MAENPLVSIIVRARNEAPALRKLFALLQSQHTDFGYEIWLLDNDSSDGSAELARAAGVEVHHIPRDAFNYASALNQGAALARGEYRGWMHGLPQAIKDLSWGARAARDAGLEAVRAFRAGP